MVHRESPIVHEVSLGVALLFRVVMRDDWIIYDDHVLFTVD